MTKTVFLLLAAASVISTASSQCLTENDDGQPLMRTARSSLYKGQQIFTVSLLDAINKASPNENIFFSPYSTYHALLLAYFGAKNQTEKELSNVLNLQWADNKNQVFQAYRFEKKMRAARAKDSDVDFAAADKIFINKHSQLLSCMKDFFGDELESMDFAAEPEVCRKEINSWVADITRNEIPEILNSGDITQSTNLVLANAAYFKGQWESKFDEADTKKGIFYTAADKQAFVDMMYKRGTFNLDINEKLGAHVLELPYLGGEGSQISMMILLPPFTPNGLENVLNNLNPETLHEAINNGGQREIEIKLPKFSFEQKIELVPVLNKMGLSNLFTPNADLSGFTGYGNLTLDDARHVAKIQVDEQGSTAAAATVLFSFRSARPLEPTKFICDHPFVFLIYDHKSQAVLFAGIYRDPTQNN